MFSKPVKTKRKVKVDIETMSELELEVMHEEDL
jgi:hypothetical protein